MLVARHSPPKVFAGKLPPFEVERVAVAVTRWVTERSNVSVLFEKTQLPVIRNIAPHQVLPLRAPRRPLRPLRPYVMPVDDGIEYLVLGEALVHRYNIRIGIAHRLMVSPVALRLCQHRRRGQSQKRSAIQTGTHGQQCINSATVTAGTALTRTPTNR